MVRYRRAEEAIADALKATRRVAREASRPTGTETALTMQTAEGAALSAEQAAIDAAAATETALGSARYSQVDGGPIVPDLPEDGPRPGAELVLIDAEGHPYQVDVWNGDAWVRAQYLADQILVLGPDGTVQISNAQVIAPQVTGGRFDGSEFYGGRFVQYASNEKSLIYPTSAGEVTPADWAGGAPDGWGAAATSTSVYQTAPQSVYASRTGAGSLSLLWSNNGRTPLLSATPRGVRLIVRATAAVSGVHVTTPAGTQEVDDLPANTWVPVDIDLGDDESLDWVHIGVTTTGGATLYVDTIEVVATALDGAHMRIDRDGQGLPGAFIVNGGGELLGSFTPDGLLSFIPGTDQYVRLKDGGLALGDDTSEARMGRAFGGTETERDAFSSSGRARPGDRFHNDSDGRDYTWTGSIWQREPIVYGGFVTITPSAANTDTSASVTLPAGLFPDVPEIVPSVSSPRATVGASSISASGFTATIRRDSTTNTVVRWIAILN